MFGGLLVNSGPVAFAGLYDGIRVFRDANLQRVKSRRLGGWRLKAEQVVVVNLVRDALQAVIKAFLGREIHVLSTGERREFRSGVAPQSVDDGRYLRREREERGRLSDARLRFRRRRWRRVIAVTHAAD